MPDQTFSIRGLLLTIVFVAMTAAALSASNQLWVSIFGNFTVFALCYASVAAILHQDVERRAFFCGLAVFGWVFLAMKGKVGHAVWVKSPIPILIEMYADKTGQPPHFFVGEIIEFLLILALSFLGGFATATLRRKPQTNRS